MALVAQPLRLPMMPMRLSDVLLPGETSRLLLKEPAHPALLNAVHEENWKRSTTGSSASSCKRTAGRCAQFRRADPEDRSSRPTDAALQRWAVLWVDVHLRP